MDSVQFLNAALLVAKSDLTLAGYARSIISKRTKKPNPYASFRGASIGDMRETCAGHIIVVKSYMAIHSAAFAQRELRWNGYTFTLTMSAMTAFRGPSIEIDLAIRYYRSRVDQD